MNGRSRDRLTGTYPRDRQSDRRAAIAPLDCGPANDIWRGKCSKPSVRTETDLEELTGKNAVERDRDAESAAN
jgi:hypothetical protein